MISYNLPRRIRYIPASAIFTANFNTPTLGKYDFAGIEKIFVLKLLANTIYLIDSLSIAGTVAGEDFLQSIDLVPIFTLRKSIDKESIFDVPIQIHNYATDRQIVHFFRSKKTNESLIADVKGTLNQLPSFVGLPSISLSINLSIHAIDSSDFEKMYSAQG